MNRFILALLALLTGLAAQVAPAQARMCGVGVAEIGSVEVARGGSKAVARQVVASDLPAVSAPHRERDTRVRPVRPAVYIPSVQLGSDRALE